MLKTATTLIASLALFLLAFAPLVLAQQENAGDTPLGKTEPQINPPAEPPPGEAKPQTIPPEETPNGETEPQIAPPAGDPPTQTPPRGGLRTNEGLPSPLDLPNPVALAGNKIVVDCVVLFQNLAELEQWRDARANDPAIQLELAQAKDLGQLCLDNGFTTPSEDPAPITTPSEGPAPSDSSTENDSPG